MNYRMKIKNVSNNKFSHQSGEIPGRWLNFLRKDKVRIPASLLVMNLSAPATSSRLAKRGARGLMYLQHMMAKKGGFFPKWTVFRLENPKKFIFQIPENRIQSCRLSQVYVVYGIFNTRGKKDAIIVLAMKRSAAFVGNI